MQDAGGYGAGDDGYGGQYQTGSNISPQELVYYEQLYGMADVERKGYIDAAGGRTFLEHSGLPLHQLRAIWEIADVYKRGALDMQRFFVALRLVAHAQSNPAQPLTPELEMVQPAILPDFQGLHRRRDPSEYSPPGSVTPSVVGGAHSDISELQPVISGGEAEVRRAADYARQASRSQSPFSSRPGRSGWSWSPSKKEIGKYASLFLRADGNRDGYIDGTEARELLPRSGLDDNSLAIAWELAAQGHTFLAFHHFVGLIHLISCVKKGAPMPQLHDGLPIELQSACQSLEYKDPHEISRSRSRSRSPSPGPTHATTQDFGEMGGFGDGFETSFGALPDEAAALENVGWEMDPPEKKKDKKKKKHSSFEEDFNFEAAQADTGDPGFGTAGWDDFGQGFGGGSSEPAPMPTIDRGPYEVSSVGVQFEAVIDADRALSSHLRKEVDQLEGELQTSQQMRDELQRHVRQEQEEIGRLVEQRKQLETQLQMRKQRIHELSEERRAANLESISLRQDRQHYAEELAFLQRMVQEETDTLESLKRSNQFLDKSYKGLEAHTQQLGWQRKEILTQVAKEKTDLKDEEKQNELLRNKLERMRREQVVTSVKQKEHNAREALMRSMQNDGAVSSW